MGRTTAGIGSFAPWLALFVAFSPILLDLAGQLAELPEERGIAFVALLLLLAILQDPVEEAASGHAAGLLGVGIGVLLLILGIVTGSWSIARVGLPVAALGLAIARGAPRPMVMVLAFLAIPIPHSLVLLTSPELETMLTRAAMGALSALGHSIPTTGASIGAAPDTIHLVPHQGVVTLGVPLAALGWYSAVREGSSPRTAVLRAAAGGLLALPLQLVVLIVTGALVALGRPELGEIWVRHIGWVAVSGCGLVWVLRLERPA